MIRNRLTLLLSLIVLIVNGANFPWIGSAQPSFARQQAVFQPQAAATAINSPACIDADDVLDSAGAITPTANAPRVIDPAISAPSVRLAPSSDTGVSDIDRLTGNNMPIFEGRAAPNQKVQIFDGNIEIGQATSDSAGYWNFAPPVCAALPDGKHAISVQANNGKGAYSPLSSVLILTIDTDPPAMPSIDVPQIQGNGQAAATITISGHAGPNLTIKVADGMSLEIPTTSNSQGMWSVKLTGLAPGTHVFRAKAIDAAGNESPSFNDVALAVDSSASSTSSGGAIKSQPTKATKAPTATKIPTSAPTATATPTTTNTPTAVPTNTALPTATDTPTNMPSATPTVMDTPTDAPTATNTPTVTPTATDVLTDTPTNTLAPTDTPTTTSAPTDTPTATPSATLTATLTPTPTATTAPSVVAVAVGDIACGAGSSGNCQQLATSNLMVNINPDAVFPLGDNQYECGSLNDFFQYYDPTWGRAKQKSFPAVGNHEYQTSTTSTDPCFNAPAGAPGYFTYFGRASTPNQPDCTVNCNGYYSFDVGAWHIVVLNSICSQVGGCGLGSAEETWLKQDLANHPSACTLAYWHYPRFTSGLSGTTFITGLKAFWQDLYNAGVDVILNGHDHDYERFAPMNVSGTLDVVHGIREFVVGTGGRSYHSFTTIASNSEVRISNTFGVMKLTLNATSYSWQFVPVAGGTLTDSGSEPCR